MSAADRSPLLLIDGHNVVHAVERYRRVEKSQAMRGAVDALINDLVNLAAGGGSEIIVVFDGREAGSSKAVSRGLTVVYSPGNRSADAVIERLVFKLANERDITVCTADYAQQKVVLREGVRRLFPSGLMDLMEEAIEEARPQRSVDRLLRVEDQLPEVVLEALDKMRKRTP